MMSEKAFRKLKLAKRYAVLRAEGDFIASRFFESFQVHLYQLGDFHVEEWYRIGLAQVCYIEVMGNPETLNIYLELIDLKKDLKL